MRSIALIFVVLFVSACDNGSSNSGATVPEEARGTWRRGCLDSANSGSTQSTLEISETTITWISKGYNETRCAGDPFLETEDSLDYSHIGMVVTSDGIEATHARLINNESESNSEIMYYIDGLNLYIASHAENSWVLDFEHPFVKQQ
ncbi:hypothetical protein [Oceanicoccus sp. KOV_DT_Chl]|uniref:hypothetical protein n=1 Tax=Oceanicoccus sp. KOV_DT_Chl TaxID=1904639 RepID=UPI000C7B5E65|nr:hypothetical protein [Oceanicoccus sp. KOV_DT_Chl]